MILRSGGRLFISVFSQMLLGVDLVKASRKCVVEILNTKNGAREPIFDVLTGIVPDINKKANERCRKMGFAVHKRVWKCFEALRDLYRVAFLSSVASDRSVSDTPP